MEAYLLKVIADRRAHPSADVLGELIAGADEDPEISDDELLMLAHAIVKAGIDNVRSSSRSPSRHSCATPISGGR